VGDTAYFDPELKSIVHYRNKRYIMVTFFTMGEPASAEFASPVLMQRIDEYATGTSGFTAPKAPGATQKTGHLRATRSRRAPSTRRSRIHAHVKGDGEHTAYMCIIAGEKPRRAARAAQVAREDDAAGRDRPHGRILAAVGGRDEHQLRQPADEGR
jgi:hypothetical protein